MKYTQQWLELMDKKIFLESVVIDPMSFSKALSLIEEIGKRQSSRHIDVLRNWLSNYMKLWIRNGRERLGIYNTGSDFQKLSVRSR